MLQPVLFVPVKALRIRLRSGADGERCRSVRIVATVQAVCEKIPGGECDVTDGIPWQAVQPEEDPVQRSENGSRCSDRLAGPYFACGDAFTQIAAEMLEHADVARFHFLALGTLQRRDLQQGSVVRPPVFLRGQPVFELQQKKLPGPLQRAVKAPLDVGHRLQVMIQGCEVALENQLFLGFYIVVEAGFGQAQRLRDIAQRGRP